jgi:hypothetical protein
LRPGDGGTFDFVTEATVPVSRMAGKMDVMLPFFFHFQATAGNGAVVQMGGTETILPPAVSTADLSALDFQGVQMSFILPPGASVTTDGGFIQTGSVPEPSTLLLGALGGTLMVLSDVLRRMAGAKSS